MNGPRKNMRRSLLALLLALALPTLALAMSPHRGGGLAGRLEMLDLDEATRTQVDAILDAGRSEARALRKEARDAREAFRSLKQDASTDEATLVGAAARVRDAQFAARRHQIATFVQVREVVPADQLGSLQKEGHGRCRGGRSGGNVGDNAGER
jgi:Spy/CpxP family protein refolding chaperone